jgi:hypothetical protein
MAGRGNIRPSDKPHVWAHRKYLCLCLAGHISSSTQSGSTACGVRRGDGSSCFFAEEFEESAHRTVCCCPLLSFPALSANVMQSTVKMLCFKPSFRAERTWQRAALRCTPGGHPHRDVKPDVLNREHVPWVLGERWRQEAHATGAIASSRADESSPRAGSTPFTHHRTSSSCMRPES